MPAKSSYGPSLLLEGVAPPSEFEEEIPPDPNGETLTLHATMQPLLLESMTKSKDGFLGVIYPWFTIYKISAINWVNIQADGIIFYLCSIRFLIVLLVACGHGRARLFLLPHIMPVSSRSSCHPAVNLPLATPGGSFPATSTSSLATFLITVTILPHHGERRYIAITVTSNFKYSYFQLKNFFNPQVYRFFPLIYWMMMSFFFVLPGADPLSTEYVPPAALCEIPLCSTGSCGLNTCHKRLLLWHCF